MLTIHQEIVKTAYIFLGQEEIEGNMGFVDDEFEALMEATGWEEGQAWCAYFVELVWRYAYALQNSFIEARLRELFHAGAVKTFLNFKNKSHFPISRQPLPGAIAIWQTYRNGKPHWTGHAGVVLVGRDATFDTIEGNTNNDGSREGKKSCKKIRTYSFSEKNGLRLLGFINPIEV